MKEAWDYTPINRVATSNVRFDVHLPEFVNGNRIGVNLSRLEKLRKLGGIGHLRVTTHTGQEISSFVPTVVGSTKDGEAYAGKTGISKKVPTYSVDESDIEGHFYDGHEVLKHQSYKWANGEIKVNLDEISTRIVKEALWSDGARSTDAWAYHLDDSIKRGIIDIGLRHTIQVDAYNKGEFSLTTAFAVLYSAELIPLLGLNPGWNPHLPALHEAVFSFLIQHQLINAWDYLRGRKWGNFRWSLLQGIEPDRALALKILAGKENLIKTLPKTQEA